MDVHFPFSFLHPNPDVNLYHQISRILDEKVCQSIKDSKLCETTDMVLRAKIKKSCAQTCGLCSSGSCVDKIKYCNASRCDEDLFKELCMSTCNHCDETGC